MSNESAALEAAISEWAARRDDVHAAVVLGSHARAKFPADAWSDLDIDLVVDDPARYAEDVSWIGEFGSPILTLVEETPLGHRRRVLYATGQEVDLPLFPLAVLDRLESSVEYASLLARGFRVLVDKIGLEERLRAHAARAVASPSAAQPEFDQLASDFWYHALWTAKKLRRGEIYTALDCLDGYLKARLVTLLEWHTLALDPSVDTWHGGRFLERWADPGAVAALETTFARYELRDVARGLWATIDLWEWLEEETARRLGLEVTLDHADLRRRIEEVLSAGPIT
jgi:aminoglycoside 6-adenylyltransferase